MKCVGQLASLCVSQFILFMFVMCESKPHTVVHITVTVLHVGDTYSLYKNLFSFHKQPGGVGNRHSGKNVLFPKTCYC